MKTNLIFCLSFLLFARANGQNEFAATGFYREFKKIHSDAQEGFKNCKGSQRKTGFEAIATEYRTRCTLPIADSGRIVFPQSAKPYAIYYFQPDKSRLKIDQQGVYLREAISYVYEKPLYSRTETFLVSDKPFTNTYYFTEPDETKGSAALFRQCIYYQDGKYMMSFEIKGIVPKID